MNRLLSCLALLVLLAVPAAGDEIRLKDGTVIRGKIVGFEDGAFKVETSYGYALVRRDKIAGITFDNPEEKPPAPAKAPSPKPAPAPPADEPPAPPAQNKPSQQAPTPPQKAAPPEGAAPAPAAPREASPRTAPAPPPAPKPATPPAKASTPPRAESPKPPEPPQPAEMRDEVEGRSYINHTYRFRLYKPPRWEIFEGAHRRLPNAIVAMGTGNETTLLVVSREPLSGSLAAHADRSERTLRTNYSNYRALGEERMILAGQPAIIRRFRAVVDEHDWSGQVAWVARGNEVFTLFGMTLAESQLLQLQENILARAIASLEFTEP